MLLTLHSAIATFVVPRSTSTALTRGVFLGMRKLFMWRLRRVTEYRRRDATLAFYAPLSLLALVPVWVGLILVGYTLMFWAAGQLPWYQAFRDAGSSLLTLGFEPLEGRLQTFLGFTAATIGLTITALLIAYLPSIYSAFSRREAAVTLLEVHAGSPPSAIAMLERYHRIHGLERLSDQWSAWETWFADIQESHTSLAALPLFRSPKPEHSWVTASGAVLDTASLTLATVDIPNDPRRLCASGQAIWRSITLRVTSAQTPIPTATSRKIRSASPAPSLMRHCRMLEASGVPLKSDRELAWLDFAAAHVNYDDALLELCNLTYRAPCTRPGRATAPPSQPFRRHCFRRNKSSN